MVIGMSPREMFELLDYDADVIAKNMQQAFDNSGVLGVERALILFKGEAKRRYRRRAKKLHPDVQGDHEKMVALNQADEFLQKLKVYVREPRQIFEVRVQTYHGAGWDATGTTSGAAAFGDWIRY